MTRAAKPAKSGGKRPASKTVKVRAFGLYLKRCRQETWGKTPSVEGVVRALRDRLDIAVDDATLRGYEYGWVDRPDPVVLSGLAALYKTDVECVIAVLKANRRKKDLSAEEVEQVLRAVTDLRNENAGAATRLEEMHVRIVEVGTALLDLARASADAGRQITASGAPPAERRPRD